MPQTLTEIVFWVFGLLITGSGGMIVKVLYKIFNSIEVLNHQMAVVIEKATHHEKELDRHDGRITALEARRSR